MSLQIEPNTQVCAILSDIIRNNKKLWATLPSGACSLETFNQKPVPDKDIPYGYFTDISTFCKIPATSALELNRLLDLADFQENTNLLVYGANSCMEWHTNSDLPGDRIYYSFTTGTSLFRYLDKDNNTVDDYDNVKTWTARRFTVSKDYPLWHTIWTEKIRFSFGFRVINDS